MPIDTKTKLLISAESAVRSRGFDGFSFADLAKDVGIRKASIHHHFPTKADLSCALMQRYSGNFEQTRKDIDSRCPTGASRLLAMIDCYRRALDGGKSLCLCVSFSTSRESLTPEVLLQMGQFRAMMLAWFGTVFELGAADGSIQSVQDNGKEAAAVLPLLEGAQLAARAQENPALFDVALDLMVQRLS